MCAQTLRRGMGEARNRESVEALNVFVRRLRRSVEHTYSITEEGTLSVNGGILSERLRVARALEARIAKLLRRLNVTVIGQNATHKAALINELIAADLSSSTAYAELVCSASAEHAAKYSISSEYGDVGEDLFERSSRLERALKCLGVQESCSRGTDVEFLPEIDSFYDSHIVYKVQFGTIARVTVEFESFEGVEDLLNLATQNEQELHGEQEQMQEFFQAIEDGNLPLHIAAVTPAVREGQILRERLCAVGKLFDGANSLHTTDGIRTCDFICYLLGKSVNYAPQVSSNCAHLLTEHIAKIQNFMKQCATKQNDLWSVIKAITVELPGSDTAETDVVYVNLPDLQYFRNAERIFHSELLEESRAIIYVCDERKMDGDFRWLLRKSLLARDISKGFWSCQLYTVIVTRQIKLIQGTRLSSFKSRLCLAKQAELKSIFAEQMPLCLHPDELKMTLKDRRLEMFTLAVSDVCEEIDSISSLLRPHLRTSHERLRIQFNSFEQNVRMLCDDLMRENEGGSILTEIERQRRTYFADQVLTTLACSHDILSRVDLNHTGNFCTYDDWSTRWFRALVSYFQRSSANVHNASVERLTVHPLVVRSEETSVRVKATFATRWLRSLCSYSRFLEQSNLRTRIMMKLGEINAEWLHQFCTDFSSSICAHGLHNQPRRHLKRLVWIFFYKCRRCFDHFVASESFAGILKFHAVNLFHEHLMREGNFMSVGDPESIKTIIDEIHFDMCVIVLCRLRAVQHVYRLAATNLQGVRSLACSLRDVANVQLTIKRMKCPLHVRRADDGCMFWMQARTGSDALSTKRRKLQHVLQCGAEICVVPQVSRFRVAGVVNCSPSLHPMHTVCQISVLVVEGLKFIEREALRRDTFVKIWGSDLLATFLFFREISTDVVRQVADQILHKFATIWLSQNSAVCRIQSIEDFLFYNEGCYVLRSLGMEQAKIRGGIEHFASRCNLQISDYLGLRTKPGTDGVKHPNKAFRFDQLSTAMVWSFFLRGNGLQIDGTSSRDIEDMLSFCGALQLQTKFATATQFRDVCYFVTHRVFTSSSWCQFALIPEEWQNELKFLRYYLPCLVEAADVELVGEFVQALRCMGVSPLDVDMLHATTFLLHARNSNTGGWLSENAAFETQYHATVCSIGALMKHAYKDVVSVHANS